MSIKYRYPGAKPFTTQEAEIFYGREKQIETLLRRVKKDNLLVLYAKSGLGKSSLLNAGLIPKLEAEQGFLSFNIRFGAFQSEAAQLPLDRARAILSNRSPLLDQLIDEQPKSLWYLLKAHQLIAPDKKDFLLILDQFEELFTYPDTAVEAFTRQLAEVLYSKIPDRYREGMERLIQREKADISPTELQRLHEPYFLRIVMAIRSDRLALLDRLKPYLPNILDSTFELAPLNIEQAEDAILNPAYESNGFFSPVFDYEDAAVDHLINFLSQNKQQEIESFQLQILCEYVERNLVVGSNKMLIKAKDLQNPQAILEDYYLSKIAAIEEEYDRLAARRLIEEGLIFEEEERRLTLYEGQIEKSYGVNKAMLDQLVSTHLVRAEPSLRGGYTYELSHDTLVAPVLKAKAERLQTEAKIRAEAEEKQRAAELTEERRKRRNALMLAGFMTVLALIAVATSLFAWYQYRKAEERQAVAENALKERNQVQIQQILKDVEILEDAGQYQIAIQKLEQARFEIDSTDTQLNNTLDRLKSN